MWRILQQDRPDDYVLATGEARSVHEFVEMAFAHIGIDIEWRGVGLEERGVDVRTGRVLVEVDPRYFRPTEVDLLLGDSTKAHAKLGWTATTPLAEVIREMMECDLAALAPGAATPWSPAHV